MLSSTPLNGPECLLSFFWILGRVSCRFGDCSNKAVLWWESKESMLEELDRLFFGVECRSVWLCLENRLPSLIGNGNEAALIGLQSCFRSFRLKFKEKNSVKFKSFDCNCISRRRMGDFQEIKRIRQAGKQGRRGHNERRTTRINQNQAETSRNM